jgi:hypothetical protein
MNPYMDEILIEIKLTRAAEALFINQPDIFDFTSETHQTEWNLAHHLANEIHKLFNEFDCDIDILKINLAKRRPDIVIHKRGSNAMNLLVVEVKRDNSYGLEGDIRKIEEYWFNDWLNYKYGAVINITKQSKFEIKIIKNQSFL